MHDTDWQPIFDLRIPGEPVAQPRVKATSFGGHTRMYTPTTTGKGTAKKSNGIAEYKALIRQMVAEAFTSAPLATPVRVDIEFVFPRPAALTWKKKPMPRIPYGSKPDRDNCDKAVLDAMKGVLFTDDAKVTAGWLAKWYAAGDEQPHTAITVWKMAKGGA